MQHHQLAWRGVLQRFLQMRRQHFIPLAIASLQEHIRSTPECDSIKIFYSAVIARIAHHKCFVARLAGNIQKRRGTMLHTVLCRHARQQIRQRCRCVQAMGHGTCHLHTRQLRQGTIGVSPLIPQQRPTLR